MYYAEIILVLFSLYSLTNHKNTCFCDWKYCVSILRSASLLNIMVTPFAAKLCSQYHLYAQYIKFNIYYPIKPYFKKSHNL